MVIDKTKPNVSLLIEISKQLSLVELFQLIQGLLEILQEKCLNQATLPNEDKEQA